MRKKDKLYTANKWNKNLFADVDRENQHIFDGLGNSALNTPASSGWNPDTMSWGYTSNMDIPTSFPDVQGIQPIDYNLKGTIQGIDNIQPITTDTPEVKQAHKFGSGKAMGVASSIIGAIPETPMTINGNTLRHGVFDMADPFYWLAGGKESKAGNTLSDIGVSAFKAGAQSGNPWVMLGGGIAKGLGSLINAGWGVKYNQDFIDSVNKNNATMRRLGLTTGKISTNEGLVSIGNLSFGNRFTKKDIGEAGFTKYAKNKLNTKYNDLTGQTDAAKVYAVNSLADAVDRADNTTDSNVMSNFLADGGPLNQFETVNDGNMDALKYGLMSDYITMKSNQNSSKQNIGNMFSGVPATFFDEGGNIEIKHPGRLTALKERTGKTEAELWAEGKPEVRKMITFARNARKWKKALGGYLDARENLLALGGPDENEDTRSDTVYQGYHEGTIPYGAGYGPASDSPLYPLSMLSEYNPRSPLYEKMHRSGSLPEEAVYGTGKSFMTLPRQLRIAYNRKLNALAGKNILREPDETLFREAEAANEVERRRTAELNRALDAANTDLWRHYALGGNVQTHGADYSTGLTHIDAGGSHEENPYDGVQMGVAPDGKPNLVEEGEVIFNDYVYSNRIELDDEAKAKFHFSKKATMSYSDAAKKLEKEVAERPNDPISKAAIKIQMQTLADEQERQKKEMESQRAQEAFAALSPEEQTELMQYAQQMNNQEQTMQEEAMAQQMPQEQMMSPEEQAMMQQQMMAQPQEAMVPQEGYAYGGHMFAGGGKLSEKEFTAGALKELQGKGYSSAMMKEIAKVMYKRYKNSGSATPRYAYYYRDLLKGFDASEAGYQANYNQMRADGMSHNTALAVLKTQRPGRWESKGPNYWDTLAAKWQSSYKPSSSKQSAQEVAAVTESPSSVNKPTTVYRSKSGNVFRTKNEAIEDNKKVLLQDNTENASAREQATAVSGNASAVPVNTASGLRPYGYYTNGNDGISTPTGFKVDNTGRAYDYTEEYKNLVRSLGADDIRKWAAEHPDDPSLKSFLERGNSLDKLTDKQWRNGALDGKYGFMHHVTDQILNGDTGGGETVDGTNTPTGNVYHAIEGDDDYLPENQADWAPNVGEETRTVSLPNGDTVIYHAPSNKTIYNYTVNSDGTFTPVEGTVPEGYVLDSEDENDTEIARTYRKAIPSSDSNINGPSIDGTIVDPTTGANVDANGNATGSARLLKPVLKSEWPRYAGLFGPAAGLALWAAGVGKPNYKNLDLALEIANKGGAQADYKPIGNYLQYRPFDIWSEQNRMNANARSTDRAIQNNAGPLGTQMAGLIANAHNNQIASGQMGKNAYEYNDNLRFRVGDFNRGTDMFNASAFNQKEIANAQLRDRQNNVRAQLAMDAARTKLLMDNDWYNGLYGNVGGLFKGIAAIGDENKAHNSVARLVASGAIKGITPENAMNAGWVKYASDGGKVAKKKKNNRRRGLTF